MNYILNRKLLSLEGLALGGGQKPAENGGNSAAASNDAKNRSQSIVSVAFSGGRRATQGSLASTLGNKIKKLQKSEDWKVTGMQSDTQTFSENCRVSLKYLFIFFICFLDLGIKPGQICNPYHPNHFHASSSSVCTRNSYHS